MSDNIWHISVKRELKIGQIDQQKLFNPLGMRCISKNHALVVLEDLKVANMSKSASGTLLEPGKMVAAKSGLNRSILDQGWHSFKSMLAISWTILEVNCCWLILAILRKSAQAVAIWRRKTV